MTADEALKEINRVISCLTDGGNMSDEVRALEFAVDAIHKCQKIKTILDTNVLYRHFAKEMKLSAISKVIDGEKQEEQFWKFLDEG